MQSVSFFIQETWRCAPETEDEDEEERGSSSKGKRKKKKKKACDTGYSLKKYSFFERIKYSIPDFFCFIRELLAGSTLKRTCQESGVHYNHTAVDYANFVRDVYKEYVFNMLKTKKLRGIVEIDESLFGRKIKHNRGRNVVNHRTWILGTSIIHFLIVHFVTPIVLYFSDEQ